MAKNTGTNLTMAGLRLAEAEMKAAKTQQEQKPLSAIIVALAEKEMKAPTMAELRQAEQWLAPNMTMAGLKLAERNVTGIQAAQRALAQMRNNKNTYMHPELQENNTIPYAANPGGHAEYPTTTARPQQTSAPNKPKPAYVQPKPRPELEDTTIPYAAGLGGNPSGYPAARPRPKQAANTYVQPMPKPELEDTTVPYAAGLGGSPGGYRYPAAMLGPVQIAMKNGEAKHPFYSEEISATDPDRETKSQAKWISDQYKAIWYDVLPGGGLSAYKALYPIIRQLSDGAEWANIIMHNLIRPEPDMDPDKEALSAKDPETGQKSPGFSKDGYIINQKQLNSGYGRGTSAANGCGWISAHNVLKALGDDHKPYDVMKEVENGALLGGTSGTDPLYLVRYFKRKGYDAKIYFTKEDVEREVLQADASIYVYGYLNPRIATKSETTPANIGAHFVACYPTGDPNHPLRILNDGEDSDYYYVDGIQDTYRNNVEIFRFIIAINK